MSNQPALWTPYIMALAWRDWGKPYQEREHPGQISHQAPSEYKSEVLLLQRTCLLTTFEVTFGNMNFKNKLKEILSRGNLSLTLLTSYH
jgi:hypothetical protein